MNLWHRIRSWRKGIFDEPDPQPRDMFDPPLCPCGHYFFVHDRYGCPKMARDQWAVFGPMEWGLYCRCKVKRLRFEEVEL